MNMTRYTLIAVAALLVAGPTWAQKSKGGGGSTTTNPVLQSWMSPEVGDAWRAGYQGQGVTITVVDDFNSGSRFYGNLNGSRLFYRHGEWTRLESSLIAPKATMRAFDFKSTSSVPLATGLNVFNLSYGMMAAAGSGAVRWSSRESSIINYATNGRAVIVKAAGNDYGTAVGQPNASGTKDYLNRDLIGTSSVIFVGALSTNGTTGSPASMASYSNIAGDNTTVQNQFLVVGVEGSKTGLYGTSFAAPIVSGYAAVVGSKFTSATPTQITNQLLSTARQDTILNYNAAIHGKGEASLTRALAPVSIN
ncbi:MAG: S8/S53 family peptidase [Hydrogenophaga sp.]